MPDFRRARPTLRLLREDLNDGWSSPHFLRALDAGNVTALHPLSELPHPVVLKAAEALGDDPSADNHEGLIRSSKKLELLEVKTGQWRAGVWCDEDGTYWIVTAGLAKGQHADHDDFYQRVARADESGAVLDWRPKDEDFLLLRRERAAHLLTEWEIAIQRHCAGALRKALGGEPAAFRLEHPAADEPLGHVSLELGPIPDESAGDEILVCIALEPQFRGSDLAWAGTVRVLISFSPPEQSWDRYGDEYMNFAEAGELQSRVAVLEAAVDDGRLLASEAGAGAHYSHAKHVAGGAINGTSIRGLCGVYFVPRQDHTTLPPCPVCQHRWEQLPG